MFMLGQARAKSPVDNSACGPGDHCCGAFRPAQQLSRRVMGWLPDRSCCVQSAPSRVYRPDRKAGPLSSLQTPLVLSLLGSPLPWLSKVPLQGRGGWGGGKVTNDLKGTQLCTLQVLRAAPWRAEEGSVQTGRGAGLAASVHSQTETDSTTPSHACEAMGERAAERNEGALPARFLTHTATATILTDLGPLGPGVCPPQGG